ncbi:MAG: deoxyribose-phosphate aldolase [Phycisphaerae bacterium]|nr:deoxyribose-phosphate aldolase [Phycisphaerae bacterium]
MYTRQQVARTIDHAVLKPFATVQEVIDNAKMCAREHVASMCVRPCDVAVAAEQLAGSDVVVSVVAGFPHGSNCPQTKAAEARLAIEQGAREIDMVWNIGRFLSGDYDYVRKDIEAVVAEARRRGVLVKVIMETCWLSPEQIAKGCTICEAAGADFVKTSTGFGDGPATPEAIDVMLRTVGGRLGVKASGGIRTWETAVGYLEQGCKRLGVAATEQVLSGAPDDAKDESY